MKAQIIQIGNSQGLRIPKMMLEETGITGEVELEIHKEGILVRNAQKPRANWDKKFKELAESEGDQDLNLELTKFERTEWKW